LRFVLGVGLFVAAAVAGCGGGGEATSLAVTLREWSVGVSRESVTEGAVRFEVTNAGAVPHEFVVVKSDLSPEGLPVENGQVTQAQVNIVDEIEPFAAGSEASLQLDLSPGKYLLICNIVERVPGQQPVSHYQNGMVALLLVEPE
jgi:uncharacterized cupredoxin-like copper-binding protein